MVHKILSHPLSHLMLRGVLVREVGQVYCFPYFRIGRKTQNTVPGIGWALLEC